MSPPNCTDPDQFYWNNSASVSSCALHNLTSYCPNTSNLSVDDKAFVDDLTSPATFFIQLFRVSLSLALLSLIAGLYNCVNVLDRNVLSSATCSMYWVVFLAFFALKATITMLLIALAQADPYIINTVGFILTALIQITLTFILIMALDHERRFRSPDNASINSPTAWCCIGLKFSRLVCSIWRVGVALYTLLPISLLVALEVWIGVESEAPSSLVWVYVVSLLCLRVIVIAFVIYLVLFTKGNCDPTYIAKIYLVSACLLSLLEDLPNSVLTMAVTMSPYGNCELVIMTVSDFFQIIGGCSLLFFALFVRSQYLRIEQECKLVLIWDMQKLLQVNGRKDIVKHYS